MLSPATYWVRKHILRAERAFRCSRWLRPYTLVTVKVFSQEHLFAVVVKLIFFCALTLFHQVVVELLHFNYLLTLKASCQHRALLPVMQVYWLQIEGLIIPTAEITHLVFWGQRLLLLFFLGLDFSGLLGFFRVWLFSLRLFRLLLRLFKALSAFWVNVSSNVYHWLRILHLLFWLAYICFPESVFDLVDLGLAQVSEALPHFVS